MIKNLVFDFGKVLVHFEPSYMVRKYVTDKNDAELLEAVVFDRLYWDRLDAGTITNEETLRLCRERLPERLHSVADEIYYNWIYNLPEIDGMRELLTDVKNDFNVPLYLLSNISLYFSSHRDEISILSLFDKCIFSAEAGRVKPMREMYAHLCDECGILPEETLFVDDSPINIEGAQGFGLNGYLFDGNAEKLREYIYSVLKK